MRAMPLASALNVCVIIFAAACSDKAGSPTPDGGTGDDSGTGSDAAPTLNLAWDWTGVVGTGQSLSVGGTAGTPSAAARVPHNNLKLSLGTEVVPPFDATLAGLTMVPLVEPIRPDVGQYPQAYPGNIDGETPHTAMADEITALVMQAAGKDYVSVHTVVGESGQGLSIINKTATEVVDTSVTPPKTQGRAYKATLFEASAITRLAGATSKTYGIGAITLIHGESDSGNSAYEAGLVQLLSDYNQDLAQITGQTAKIPMLVSQQNSVPTTAGMGSVATVQQWKIGVDHAGDFICVGPKYQYVYNMDQSGYIHLNNQGYDMLGEKLGQVFFERVVAGHDWQPLQPVSATRNGKVITVKFHVPVPPLMFDDSLPTPHPSTPEWTMGKGFEVTAASAPATIDSVAITGPDTVDITVRSDLTGLAVQVSYALITEGPALVRADGSHGTHRWGALRDADPFVGAMTSMPQPNWCVSFQMDVP